MFMDDKVLNLQHQGPVEGPVIATVSDSSPYSHSFTSVYTFAKLHAFYHSVLRHVIYPNVSEHDQTH